jgi:hypothetical protein
MIEVGLVQNGEIKQSGKTKPGCAEVFKTGSKRVNVRFQSSSAIGNSFRAFLQPPIFERQEVLRPSRRVGGCIRRESVSIQPAADFG